MLIAYYKNTKQAIGKVIFYNNSFIAMLEKWRKHLDKRGNMVSS